MKKLSCLIIILFSFNSFAQKEANIWYFGRNAGIDFNTSPPTGITGGQTGSLNTLEGCSSFSDSNGNLLFYSDGITVYNSLHSVMNYSNGNPASNLKGDPSSTQSGMIIPKPGSSDIYYLFTVGNANNPAFDLYTIDMSRNGGLGELIDEDNDGVFSENLALPTGRISNWSEKVAAVKGSECNTFWVVSSAGNNFYAYKIDSNGVDLNPIISQVSNFISNSRGYLKLSPDGSKLAIAHQAESTQCLIYSFDNLTGVVSNDGNSIFNDNQDGQAYGLEFSRSSEKLYVSSTSGFRGSLNDSSTTYRLFQYDLTAVNIEASKTLIHQEVGYRGALQLGPDGRIYATIPLAYNDTNGDAQFLDVIENPNADAANIIFTQNAIDLNGQKSTQGLPPFISSLLLPLEITEAGNTTPLNDQTQNLCTGTNITFSPETITGNPNYIWTFDNGSTIQELYNGSNSDLTLTNLNSTNNGTYNLTATTTDDCGVPTISEGEFLVIVFDQPTATQPTNPIQSCDNDTVINDRLVNFDLSLQDATILGTTQSASVFEVLYFTDAGYTNQIPRNTTPINGNDATDYTSDPSLMDMSTNGVAIQTIYAQVRNINNIDCVAETNFEIEVYENATPTTTITLLAECDNTSVGSDTDGTILFNLTDRASEILNTQTAGFTLTYFTDATYTLASQIPENTTPIAGNDITSYQNDTALNDANGRQTIYVRMTNDLTATHTTPCFTDTSFEIEVYELPKLLKPLVTLIQCNDDLTGVEEFNLRLKEDELSANFATDIFTYYETPTLAEAGVSGTEIGNPTAYPNQVPNNDTVWVRIETTDGCYRVAQVDLDINPSSAVMNGFVTREFSQCDDGTDKRNGIATFNFSSVTTDIQTLFSPLAVDVLYYETEAQANQGLEIDQIDASNYDNITQDQLIWVQIVSDFGSDCLAKGQYVQLHVEELPTANMPTTIMKVCDDDNDGMFSFDISTITSEILGTQSLADVSINYFNENGTQITGVNNSSLPNPFLTTSQTIDIVVTNNSTNSNQACFDSTTLTFIVNDAPRNNVQPINPECETDPEDGMLIATFDTSNLESSINAQTGMDITYLDANGNNLQDINGNLIVSPFPNSFTTETQTITVVVTNPLNTSCPASSEVDFIVNPRPIFDNLTDELICVNSLPHIISVKNPDASNYTYEWFNTTGITIGTDQELSITDATDISTTGVKYSVTVTNPTTGCNLTKTVNLKKSSIATLLDQDIITTEFNSPTNTIEINTTNLGFGDYEFKLEHDSDNRQWQDEPIFENLQGGMYTILINDKNDCGETFKVIFLLDYPKFLTPNNDGYNDYWQLIGLDSTTYRISPLHIFDRFGKIIAIINPTSGQGWDGLYNNEMLPSSDYWFTVSLTNSDGETIVKKGHFSLIRR